MCVTATTMDPQLELCLEEESDRLMDIEDCKLDNDSVLSPAVDDTQAMLHTKLAYRLKNQFFSEDFEDEPRKSNAGHRLKVSCLSVYQYTSVSIMVEYNCYLSQVDVLICCFFSVQNC